MHDGAVWSIEEGSPSFQLQPALILVPVLMRSIQVVKLVILVLVMVIVVQCDGWQQQEKNWCQFFSEVSPPHSLKRQQLPDFKNCSIIKQSCDITLNQSTVSKSNHQYLSAIVSIWLNPPRPSTLLYPVSLLSGCWDDQQRNPNTNKEIV